jgi:hypothetical protein
VSVDCVYSLSAEARHSEDPCNALLTISLVPNQLADICEVMKAVAFGLRMLAPCLLRLVVEYEVDPRHQLEVVLLKKVSQQEALVIRQVVRPTKELLVVNSRMQE